MAFNPQGMGYEQFSQIQPGWEIFGADGEKIGTVDQVQSNYFVVSQGFIFTSERYIPVTAVRGIEAEQVHLSVTGDEIASYGWDSPQAIQSYLGTREQTTADEPSGQVQTAGEHEHLELREEELRVSKRTVEAGEVDISKEVFTEREELDVPRHHEEVDINYRPSAERRPAEGEIGEDEEIRVPLHEEQIRVDKETVVSGEVDIDKRDVEEIEHIEGDVRKERLRVEREGDVHINESDIEEERRQ